MPQAPPAPPMGSGDEASKEASAEKSPSSAAAAAVATTGAHFNAEKMCWEASVFYPFFFCFIHCDNFRSGAILLRLVTEDCASHVKRNCYGGAGVGRRFRAKPGDGT